MPIQVGGSNPQNVGGLVHYMQRPLFFSAPRESRALKAAWSIYYKGFTPSVSPVALRQFHQWQASAKAANGGVMPGTLEARQWEASWLHAAAKRILAEGTHAAAILRAQEGRLPGGGLLGPAVKNPVRGLIDPEARDADWAPLTALLIRNLVLNTGFTPHGKREAIYLQVDEDQTARWLRIIEEAL